MKPGPRPTLPSVKADRGTLRPVRDAGKEEFVMTIPNTGMPQRPEWLTPEGEIVWQDNVMRAVPPLTESDSITFATFCNLVAANGAAFACGQVPPLAAVVEMRRLAELFGMAGANSRVGRRPDGQSPNGTPNPYGRFKRQPADQD